MAQLKTRKENRRALKAALRSNGGSNVQSLTEDQERALHFIHVGEYDDAQRAVKLTMAARKTTIARIRSEGGNIEQIKASIELETPEGEERVITSIKLKSKAARWAGVGLQLDLFDQDRADATQQYELGKTAGLKGINPDNDNQDWLTGWHAGQDALTATLVLFRKERRPEPVEHGPEPEPSPEVAVNEPETPVEERKLFEPDIDPATLSDGEPWSDDTDLTEGEVDSERNLADPVE